MTELEKVWLINKVIIKNFMLELNQCNKLLLEEFLIYLKKINAIWIYTNNWDMIQIIFKQSNKINYLIMINKICLIKIIIICIMKILKWINLFLKIKLNYI